MIACHCRRCMVRKGYVVAHADHLSGMVKAAGVVLAFVAVVLFTLWVQS